MIKPSKKAFVPGSSRMYRIAPVSWPKRRPLRAPKSKPARYLLLESADVALDMIHAPMHKLLFPREVYPCPRAGCHTSLLSGRGAVEREHVLGIGP